MSLSLLFTAHNRRAFVEASFETLLQNTNWDLVDRLIVLDDNSTDGTADWLAAEVSDFYGRIGFAADYETRPFGGPVAAMNHALDLAPCDLLAKIDSDVIVCPGWLDAMLEVLGLNPQLDALGMEPGFGGYDGTIPPVDEVHAVRWASHIGGVGVFRSRVFAEERPRGYDTFHGLTQHWQKHAACGWISPDLPVFLLDHLPVEPWRSLAREYVAAGWSRKWPAYPESWAPYWTWWTGDREAVA